MHSSSLLSLATTVSLASATVYKGFNYGNTFTDGTIKTQTDFENEFEAAQNLVGASGFTSARLYTMIEGGTTNDPIVAIPAAIAKNTSLLLGVWASAGQESMTNEIAALTNAITKYGTAFTDIVVGLSIGSEDLYRITPTGIENKAGVGADPSTIVDYINQVKKAIAGTTLSKVPLGHVDTWTAWVNGSNSAVIEAVDWLGVDSYPYFQNTETNSIANAYDLFWEAYDATEGVSGGKEVWITETGWPISGDTENLAIASVQNAQTYWQEVGCARAFGNVNTWWYILQDAAPTTPVPSFGIVGSDLSSSPLYDLSCKGITTSATNLVASTATAPSGSASGSANGTASGSAGGSTLASVTGSSTRVSATTSPSTTIAGGGASSTTPSAIATSSNGATVNNIASSSFGLAGAVLAVLALL